MTPRQQEIIEHSLGLNHSAISYRNHYAADPADPELREMVRLGLMRKGKQLLGGLQMYHVEDRVRESVLTHSRSNSDGSIHLF